MPGEHLLVKRLSPTARIFERGTLLLLKHPLQPDLLTIKRLVGLPNELVALVNGELSIDRQPHREDYLSSPYVGEHYTWHSGESQYVVLGDNRRESYDSRHYGVVDRALLLGTVWFRYLPFDRRGRL
jgi:signal peptidase I